MLCRPSKARSTKQARAAGMTVEATIWQWLLPHAVGCGNTCLISSNYACMTEISGQAERLPKEMLYQALLDSGLIGLISDRRGKKGLRKRPRDRWPACVLLLEIDERETKTDRR